VGKGASAAAQAAPAAAPAKPPAPPAGGDASAAPAAPTVPTVAQVGSISVGSSGTAGSTTAGRVRPSIMAANAADELRTMEGDLDAIADSMRAAPHSEEQRVMIGDMLKKCGDKRKNLEDMAMLVIDTEHEGGEETFNTITARLDRLERLQEEYQTWGSSALADPISAQALSSMGSTGNDLSSARSSMHPMASIEDAEGAREIPFKDDVETRGPQRFNSGLAAGSETGSKKEKKKKKERKWASAMPEVDFAAFPAATADVADGGRANAAAASSTFGGGWPSPTVSETGAGADAASWGAAGAGSGAPWPGPPTTGLGSVSVPAADGAGFDVNSGGAWGSAAIGDAAAALDQSGFGTSPNRAFELPSVATPQRQAPSQGPAAAAAAVTAASLDPTSSGTDAPGLKEWQHNVSSPTVIPAAKTSGTSSQVATFHIRCPYAEVEQDINHFSRQFARAAANATGISPHRIRVIGVKPHG